MARPLETFTLDNRAKELAGEWLRPDRKSRSGKRFVGGPSLVMQDMYNFTYKDEFEYMLARLKDYMGPGTMTEFEKEAKKVFTPRKDDVFHALLKRWLAVDPDGNHLPGVIGIAEVGNRIVGVRHQILSTKRLGRVVLAKNAYWPIYAGEEEERAAGRIKASIGASGDGADPLPPENYIFRDIRGGATNPNISAAAAILACDAIVDSFDDGSSWATIRGRTGAQPADPDAAESGTLLFTLPMAQPAFNPAADATPGGAAAADTIVDDTSADNTNTLTYCRAGSTGVGADDILDGSAATSGADYNFNTVSIVAGATVSMTSMTVTVPQGATAT